MNPPDYEHPALTAYALGELGPAESATIERMIATSPDVRAEYERIAQTAAVLGRTAAMPRRNLHPRQRETVLAMGQTPARGPKVVPFSRPAPPTHRAAWSFVKFAAAACLAAGAFLAGQHFAPRARMISAAQTDRPLPEPPAAKPEIAPALQVVVKAAQPAPSPVEEIPVPKSPKVDVAPTAPPAATVSVAETPEPVRSAGAPAELRNPPAPAPPPQMAAVAPSRPAAPSGAARLKGFTLAQAQPETMIALQPKLMRAVPRPVPREFAGQLLAAPAPDKPKTGQPSAAAPRPEPQPQLVIHSWKAEIASCPWDTSHRLMRFVAQIPVEQDGVESNTRDYQIAVKFDPAQVQGWRQIMEKHMPPTGGGTLATRFAWYEIIPGRSFAPTRDKPAALGSLDIVQPRGPARDSQPLRLLDRGLGWNEAREDFVFETAMIGFNLLLQGTENIGALNHKLVLEVAEQSKGEDPRGERAKFIGIVRQAEKAAGL